MASPLTLTGLREVSQRLQTLETQTMSAMVLALHQRAEALMDASQALVPVVTGELRGSGMVFPVQVMGSQVSVTVGYGAPYALSVHENPRSGRTGGVSPRGVPYAPGTFATSGQYHFLSEPFAAVQETFADDMALFVRRILRRA